MSDVHDIVYFAGEDASLVSLERESRRTFVSTCDFKVFLIGTNFMNYNFKKEKEKSQILSLILSTSSRTYPVFCAVG